MAGPRGRSPRSTCSAGAARPSGRVRPSDAVDVVEPRPELGQGIAFGTPEPWHRLNVPAIVMSAFPDEPDHFTRWAGVDETRSRTA